MESTSYLSVKSHQMTTDKIYYHYSKQYNSLNWSNAKWVRLIDYLNNSEHMSIISSDYWLTISNDNLIKKYASMKSDDRSQFHYMINDTTSHPYDVIAEKCKINPSDINDLSQLRFSQPRKEFYDSQILLEVLDIEKFPFANIVQPKNWKKNWIPSLLTKDDIRDIKLNHILT
jgi:hypothetical protein